MTAPTTRRRTLGPGRSKWCKYCSAYIVAIFKNGDLAEVYVQHSYGAACRGLREPRDPAEWLPPKIAVLGLDGRPRGWAYDPDKQRRTADVPHHRMWDDHVPAKKPPPPSRRTDRTADGRNRR